MHSGMPTSTNVLQLCYRDKAAELGHHRCRLVQALSKFRLVIFVQVHLDAAFAQSDDVVQMQTANIDGLVPADTTYTLEEDREVGHLKARKPAALLLDT